MTVSSWFRSDKPSLKDILPCLYPKKNHYDCEDRSRFSHLLLEHGEKHLQDWAVVAYSNLSSEVAADSSAPRTTDHIQWAQAPTARSSSNRRKASVHPNSMSGKMMQQMKRSTIDLDSLPSVNMTKIEGRLHLCSRSLVFEPNDHSRGILRCPFAKMNDTPKEYPSDKSFAAMCVEFSSKRHYIMKVNNVIGPFEHVSLLTNFRFTFLHSSPTAFVELCHKLFDIASHTKSGHHHQQASPELDALLKPMLDRPFHHDNLFDIREQILVTLRASIMTPLQAKPGVMAITAERIYFQPASGVLSTTQSKAIYWNHRDVLATARRYNGLRDSALEIYWKDDCSTLFAFERRHDREQIIRFLPQNVCLTDRDFVVRVHQEWHKGNISNFDYLLALNSAAGRSFHDLSRYPVFPWVIKDYESSKLDLNNEATFRDLTKPVGALNAERLEYFLGRLHNMQDMGEAFLYGTHYSAPGYVLYYLVRSMPEHMLCLQNGKFDSPDRMFHSIQRCFDCVLTNHADVKELIPQFYSLDFDFLINARSLQLGATQNGERVNDVQLPPWARSPRDFVKKNRAALESDYCTKVLPRWIDLIFGYLSRGEGAISANNVFHHFAYLGPAELAGMQTEEERFAAELQATEFGIVPDQLFCEAHPVREEKTNDGFITADLGRASSKDDGGRETWELLEPPSQGSQDEPKSSDNASDALIISSLSNLNPAFSEGNPYLPGGNIQSLASTDSGFSASNVPLRGAGQSFIRSALPPERIVPVSSVVGPASPLPSSPQVKTLDTSSASEWDIKVLERKQIHSDAVSGCTLLLNEIDPNKSILVTTSLDGGLQVHKLTLHPSTDDEQDRKSFPATLSRFSYSSIISRGQVSQLTLQSKLTQYRIHTSRDPLASLVLASDGVEGHVAFAGGHDDVVLAYGINSACAVASVYSHRDAVTGLDLIPRTPFDSDSSLWLENSTHIMTSGSWDATVKVWSLSVSGGEAVAINREPLAELFDADSSIVCISAKSLPVGGIVIAAGCADGSFCAWNVHSDGVQVVIHKEAARRGSGPCSVVEWVSVSGRFHLFAAFSTGMVASYSLLENRLKRDSAVSVGVAVLSLVYVEQGALLIGCSDGCLRLLPVRDGAYFSSKPTLWSAVNNKSSPGISSISVQSMSGDKCICCTGGEDGSVALFELQKADSNV